MKNIMMCFCALLMISAEVAGAKKSQRNPAQVVNSGRGVVAKPPPGGVVDKAIRDQLEKAISQIKAGQYIAAADRLFTLSNNSSAQSMRPRIKYLLGISLMELNLNQSAAFQFVDVIRSADPNWTKAAIEKLLIATDKLGDETLLNFAIQRVEINQIPEANREMLFYRLADAKHKEGQRAEAIDYYKRITPKSRYYYNALYNLGLAHAELGQTDMALQAFQKLLASRSNARVNDTNRVAAQMGIARVYYQKKDWKRAIDAYAKIPRDHALWHAALFEQTWAMLRSVRFRSTLSNFHSLHSSYYEDNYLPETLLLRAIVYLYICQYDEMEKVLSLFDTQYGPSLKRVNTFLNQSDLDAYFQEVNKGIQVRSRNVKDSASLALPYNITKHIISEGDVRRNVSYLKKIIEEKKLVEENAQIKSSAIGGYASRLLTNRINSTRNVISTLAKKHLEKVRAELTDLTEQAGFIRYEMINGKKEQLKRRIEGKNVKRNLAPEESRDREFYIENGYQYYPFQGEYWLDEIGNYHYLGKQSCE